MKAAQLCVGPIVAAALLLAPPPGASAVERAPLEVVVVLDTSGSMKRSDPKRLSQFAVEVLARFLDDDDRLAVVPLGASTRVLPLTRVRDLRGSLGDGLDALDYSGGTPCLDAMQRAEGLLGASTTDPDRQVLVLLTDGICHEGQADKRTRDDALVALAQRLGARKRRLFGVPLGDNADLGMVSTLTALTEADWPVAIVRDARQLPTLFAALSAAFRDTEAKTVPLALGAQTLDLDPYLRRVTVLATADSSPVKLTRVRSPSDCEPAEAPIAGRFPRTGRPYSGYSVLKLDHPERGPWTLQVEGRSIPAAVAVYDYDLRAHVEIGSGGDLGAGETADVKATLQTPGGDPVEAAFLRDTQVRLEVREPGGRGYRDLGPMAFDGLTWFTQKTALHKLGKHVFRVHLVRGRSLDLRAWAAVSVGPVVDPLLPPGQKIRCLDPDAANDFRVALRDALGQPLAAGALAGREVSLWTAAADTPDDVARAALFERDAESGQHVARWKPPGPGRYRYEVRVSTPGEPDVRSSPADALAPRIRPEIGPPAVLGELRPGQQRRLGFIVGGERSEPVTVRLDPAGMVLPEGVTVTQEGEAVAPGETGPIWLTVKVAPGCDVPDGAIAGSFRFQVEGVCLGAPLTIAAGPATGTVRAHTFWECWGDAITWSAIGFLFLLWLFLLARCAGRTHRFPENLRVSHGMDPKDLYPIDLNDSKSGRNILIPGRCKSQRLYWNAANATFGRTRDPTWYLEAAGGSAVRIVGPAGTRLEAAPAANASKLALVGRPPGASEGAPPATRLSYPVNPAQLYKIGPVWFRVE